MAQLPPKIPTMTQNWSPLPLHKLPLMAPNHTSWIDDFLDFSSARRVAHRRSVSDSIAFLELPLVNDSRNSPAAINVGNAFERLDDEQLMSMFSDDVSHPATAAVSSSNTSTPSDQNSDDADGEQKPPAVKQELKNEPGEVVSSSQSDAKGLKPEIATPPGDNTIDSKRVKRILANRQSAQRSRVRKLQYISELERSVTTLQSEVSALSPRVAFLDHQRLILNVDNSALKQRIAALAQDKLFKDAHQEALKKEIERLRQVYHQQNIKKMSTNQNAPPRRQPNLEDRTDV